MRKLKLLFALCMVAIAASASKTVYLAPGAWDLTDATERYALYMFDNEASTNAWVSFTEGTDGVWSAEFDETFPNMILCRMNGASTENNWDNKWSQTSDLDAPYADGLLYTMTSVDDNASTYFITPYALSKGGKFYLKSVAANKYWGAGNDWGTRASLVEHPEYVTLYLQNDGRYTIDSQVSNGGDNHYFNGDYMDNSNAHWLTFTTKGNGNYTIADDGPSYYGYDGTSTVLGKNIDGTTDNALWSINSEADMRTMLEAATKDAPVDATWLILDPNFGRNNRNVGAWEKWSQNAENKTNLNISGGNNTNNCAESYHAKFYVKQTLTGVPNGVYELTAQGFYRQDGSDNENLPYFYINSEKQNFPLRTGSEGSMSAASESFTNGLYTINPIRVNVTNGTITLGAENETNLSLWCIWDNFTLKYFGVDLSEYEATITEKRAELNGLLVSPMNATVKSNAQTVYNETANVEQTAAAMEQAITNIQNALDAVNASIANYAAAKAQLERAATLDADGQASYAANETVVALQAAYDAATFEALTNEQIAAMDAAIIVAAKAQTSENADMTLAIVNPGFETGNLNGWTNTNLQAQNNASYDNKQGSFYAERWHTDLSLDINQTLTDMPAGYYELSAYVYSQYGDGKLYANEASTGVTASQLYSVIAELPNGGNLKIGASGTLTSNTWFCVDDFKLKYLGVAPISVLSDKLQAAIDAAKATANTLAVPAGVKNALTTTASDYETAKASYTTAEQFTAAMTAIEDAVADAEAAVAPTAENPKVLAKATATTTELAGLADADKTILQGVIDGNDAALAACATAAEVEAQNEALWEAIGTAINSITVTGTDRLDLTFLLTNPNVDSYFVDGQYNIHVEGWYTEQDGGNFQVVPGEGCANADGIHKHAYEYWSENPRSNGKFTLYQKLGLPEGTYTINCYAFADQSIGGDNRGIYFYANDTQGSLVANNTLTQQEVSFVNDDQQEVKIGLKAIAGNTYRWMGIGYMELYKVPAKSYTVDETVAWDATTEGAGAVTLKRTIKAGVNTLVLPFSMTQAEVEANFGADSKVYALDSYNATTENLSFKSHDGISANMPCLLKATEAGTSYTLEGRTIVAGTPETVVTGAKMVGIYAAMNAPQGSYIISGGKIYNVNSDVALKNTRAYIELTGSTARALTFTLDGGETTGIATMENGQLNVETGVIYDLSGRVVKNPTKGIYVINGKKIVK